MIRDTVSESVIIALIPALGGVMVAIIGAIATLGIWILPKLRRIDANSRQANEQVSNDHVYLDDNGNPILDRHGNPIRINLRVQQDYQHDEIRDTLKTYGKMLATLLDFAQENRRDINQNTKDIHTIEDTLTPQQAKDLQHG